MLLNGQERLVLLNSLPQEGNLVTMKLMRQLREVLTLTEEEMAQLDVTNQSQQIPWDRLAGLEEIDVDTGEIVKDLIVSLLKKLDETNRLTTNHLSLYQKFVEAG